MLRPAIRTRYRIIDVWVLLLFVAIPCLYPAALAAEPIATAEISFDRDVRLILSEHCFKCHGPDAGKLKAGLCMDRSESVFQPLDSGTTAIVPYKLDESEVIHRITSAIPDSVMPPVDEEKPLTDKQISLLKRWVEEVTWTNHWSFEPIRMPPVPQGNLAMGQVENPIDAFVLERLKSLGLSQSPRRTSSIDPSCIARSNWSAAIDQRSRRISAG